MYRDFVENKTRRKPRATRVYLNDEELLHYPFRPYVFFVVNVNDNHWILVLFHRMGDLLSNPVDGAQLSASDACIVIFDSLGGQHPVVASNICRFIESRIFPSWGLSYEIQGLATYYPAVSPLKMMFLCH